MKILVIGDVTGNAGCGCLRELLPGVKKQYGVDMVVANGENSSPTNGISPRSAGFLFDSGVNVITTGNHVFRRKEIFEYLDSGSLIIRPANYAKENPGKGWCAYDMGRIQVCVVNLIGSLYLENNRSPFDAADEVLNEIARSVGTKNILVDFHAEATSEKRAMGFYLDGRVSAVFGTHTHVPTADACLLPKGTAYITDLGMTGPVHSVIGMPPEVAVKKFRTGISENFRFADGLSKMDTVLLDLDEKSGNISQIMQLTFTQSDKS